MNHLGYWKQRSEVYVDAPAVVLFSGGQDSTTVLAVACRIHGARNVLAIGCNYGQRHLIELDCARDICAALGVKHQILNLKALGESVTTELTNTGDKELFVGSHPRLTNLPSSFVPARNALMLTMAFALAGEINARWVYSGVCQADYSGYPDCREPFVSALQGALQIGYDQSTEFVAPIMHLSKAETFALAEHVGALDLVVERSHTCYNGVRGQLNDWGHGCGSCPACRLREKGWNEFRGIPDVPIE